MFQLGYACTATALLQLSRLLFVASSRAEMTCPARAALHVPDPITKELGAKG